MNSSPDDVVSEVEAAKLLFVSRPHILRLIEEGKLPLHHRTDQTRFLKRVDVLAYKSKQQADARAFFETQTEDQDPIGL